MEPVTSLVGGIFEGAKRRCRGVKTWPGRPGLLGFALLGLGVFISGFRHDNGMGWLLVTVIIAFIGECLRLAKGGGQ